LTNQLKKRQILVKVVVQLKKAINANIAEDVYEAHTGLT
jgi:hypothetical protein